MSVDTQIKFARQGKIYFWTLMMDSLARKKKKKLWFMQWELVFVRFLRNFKSSPNKSVARKLSGFWK
jgi:hypothetical protein